MTSNTCFKTWLPVSALGGSANAFANTNAISPYDNGAELVSLATATKVTLTAVAGGSGCTTTLAIVGDDAFCAATPTQPKVLRLAGAGKL